MSSRYRFHLLPNAHLDPVWLWDWPEGLTEGVTTCRTMVGLMDEFPELTFLRGEAVVYEHIRDKDPELFARIRELIAAGRWDVVGGTWLQADTNLSGTEALIRQFSAGREFFQRELGVRPRVAWFADTFGHPAGLPEILAACGMDSLAFTRPGEEQAPVGTSAFWWEGESGRRILCYRPAGCWGNGLHYACDRQALPKILDTYLAEAPKQPFTNVGVLFGLGNHGGGPTRRHLMEVREWAARHPEVDVRFSSLQGFFDALRKEIPGKPPGAVSVHHGELNFCLRGCYASMAKLKFAYRKTKARALRAERLAAVAQAVTDTPTAPLASSWRGILFNAFHDILPGSSIERAMDDQLAWLGGAFHEARRAEDDALRVLATAVDTTVPRAVGDQPGAVPFLIWNPHPRPFDGLVELEAGLDYRPLWDYQNRPEAVPVEVRDARGRSLPFQRVQTEHLSFCHIPWRARVLVPLKLPPLGWTVCTLGLGKSINRTKGDAASPAKGTISAGKNRISARVGASGIEWLRNGRPALPGGLGCITVADEWGSWGAMDEAPESFHLDRILHTWKVAAVETLESGPLRAALWVRLTGGHSWLELTFRLSALSDKVDVDGRLLINERSARIQLVFPGAGKSAEFEVPGGTARRGEVGEVPGQRWVAWGSGPRRTTLATDALHSFSLHKGALHATLARASRYATDEVVRPDEHPWQPAVDAGELRFRFVLARGECDPFDLASELEIPPLAATVTPSPGPLARTGSLARLDPRLRLLALTPDGGGGLLLRLQNKTTAGVSGAKLDWSGTRIPLQKILPGEIVSLLLRRSGKRWRLQEVTAAHPLGLV